MRFAADVLRSVSTDSLNYGKSMGEKSILGISRDLRMILVHIEMIGCLTESVSLGGLPGI